MRRDIDMRRGRETGERERVSGVIARDAPRVYIQNAPVCTFKTVPCVVSKTSVLCDTGVLTAHTEGRSESTRGSVLNVHTGAFFSVQEGMSRTHTATATATPTTTRTAQPQHITQQHNTTQHHAKHKHITHSLLTCLSLHISLSLRSSLSSHTRLSFHLSLLSQEEKSKYANL